MKKNIINILHKVRKIANSFSSRKECNVCEKSFYSFTKWNNGTKGLSSYERGLDTVGSDIDNFGCMYCGAHDRERHLFMYFDKLNLWDVIPNSRLLHFAPENNLSQKIESLSPEKYIKADFYPTDVGVQKVDATAIPYGDNEFDIVLCNHVLEHIPNFQKALDEIYRIIKPNGIAILQTPFSKTLAKHFEDDGIKTDELRRIFYGQNDHVRRFGEKQFFKDLEMTGFELDIKEHNSFFKNADSFRYGVNHKEDLVKVIKK